MLLLSFLLLPFLLILILVSLLFLILFLRVPRNVFDGVFLSLNGKDFTVALRAFAFNSGSPFIARTGNGVALKFSFLRAK